MANPYGDQLEVSVLAASPVELTSMLFDKLLLEIRNARHFLREGEIRLRCQSASRAVEVVGELARSLDEDRGGGLSRNLRLMYVYVVEQVNEGNIRQEAHYFTNAETVVAPLAEAWRELSGRASGTGVDQESVPCWGDSEVAGSLSFSG